MPTASAPLILASGSPRRVALLGEVGVPFQTVVSDAPETIDPGLTPEVQAVVLAERKARAVASQFEAGIVLGADTIVILKGHLLGKPVDDADATRMLRRLSGREHRVVTGIAVIDAATGSVNTSDVTSIVRFRALSDREIAAYVATGEPRGKAGAYAIQGIGAGLVSALDGCFTNVVGLPLCETARLLRAAGVAVNPRWPGCRLPDGAPCPRLV
jgi:septum formation protein